MPQLLSIENTRTFVEVTFHQLFAIPAGNVLTLLNKSTKKIRERKITTKLVLNDSYQILGKQSQNQQNNGLQEAAKSNAAKDLSAAYINDSGATSSKRF